MNDEIAALKPVIRSSVGGAAISEREPNHELKRPLPADS